MSDKKHIDRLFQEHLKDLDQSPDPAVWKAIEAELHKKKKKRRVIPIWWRAAGVAALLLLFLAISNVFFKSPPSSSNNTQIVAEDSLSNTIESTKTIITKTLETELEEETKVTETETISTANTSGFKTNEASKNTTIPNTTSKTIKEDVSNLNTSKALVSNQKDKSEQKDLQTAGFSTNNLEKTPEDDSDYINSITEHTAIAETSTIKTSENTLTPTKQEQTKLKDTLSIEEAIAQTQPKEKSQTKRWDINPNLAPVYYNAAGTGSHLDDQFVNNSKTGEINTSYGVSVGYALNNKLKIRSGVNSLKLSFNTNDVVIYANAATSMSSQKLPQLKHVNPSGKAENLSMVSANNFPTVNDNSFFNQNETAIVNQNINYFEVPLELEYNIINKRFGLHVFGGFSTFFLDDNAVYSESNTNRSYIGEANNLNDISFSTNLGIGVDYNFSKRFNINLEPTVKYQLNAYNETSGNVRPYILGVYTGFSYKF